VSRAFETRFKSADRKGGRRFDALIEGHANDVKRQRHYTLFVQLLAARESRPHNTGLLLIHQAMLSP